MPRCADCIHGHVARSAEPCDRCEDFALFAAKPAAPPVDFIAMTGELALLQVEHRRRVTELLAANNALVEKRRQATALLREAADWMPVASTLYHRIGLFLSEIHA